MIDPEPIPRPGLFTNGDNDAWVEQVLFLSSVLRMPFWQIAAIDHGILPEHPDAKAIPFLELQYGRMFREMERFDATAEIERIRRSGERHDRQAAALENRTSDWRARA